MSILNKIDDEFISSRLKWFTLFQNGKKDCSTNIIFFWTYFRIKKLKIFQKINWYFVALIPFTSWTNILILQQSDLFVWSCPFLSLRADNSAPKYVFQYKFSYIAMQCLSNAVISLFSLIDNNDSMYFLSNL